MMTNVRKTREGMKTFKIQIILQDSLNQSNVKKNIIIIIDDGKTKR